MWSFPRQSTAEGASQSGGLAPSFLFFFLEGVRGSQEWDEVVNEVKLMIMRLDAFRDDLTAAVAGGELTEDQCECARYSIAMASWCSLYLLDRHVKATSRTAEKGDTQE